jgi:hypothetical protein
MNSPIAWRGSKKKMRKYGLKRQEAKNAKGRGTRSVGRGISRRGEESNFVFYMTKSSCSLPAAAPPLQGSEKLLLSWRLGGSTSFFPDASGERDRR